MRESSGGEVILINEQITVKAKGTACDAISTKSEHSWHVTSVWWELK